MAASQFALMATRSLAGAFRLSTEDRSVRAENASLLMRRWHLARAGMPSDPAVMDRWFPLQRGLFDLLAVMTEEEVQKVCDCGIPLFGVPRVAHINPSDYIGAAAGSQWEECNSEEVYMALTCRLDGLRTDRTNAAVVFDIMAAEAAAIARLSPFELRAVAKNPMMVMQPAASDQYFIAAATHDFTPAQRTVLATKSRRAYAN